MLPFLKPKLQTGLIVSKRKPDEASEEPKHTDDSEMEALEVCMQDLIRALGSKDDKAAAKAYKAAFECCESYPHEEADHSFDSMNELAAKQKED